MSQDQLVRFWLAGMIVAAVVGAFVPTIIEYTTEQYTLQQYVTVSDERVREIVKEEVAPVAPSVTKEYVDQRLSEFGQRADAGDAALAQKIAGGDSALLAKVNGEAARVDLVADGVERAEEKAAVAHREASNAVRHADNAWFIVGGFVAVIWFVGFYRKRRAGHIADNAGHAGLSAERPRRGDSNAAGPGPKEGK